MPDKIADLARLDELCGIVRKGFDTFLEVGSALREIRDNELHKLKGISTFTAFVQIEFGFSRQHAYKAIAAAEVIDGMSHNATKPETLTAAIEVGKLPPAEREGAMEEAVRTAKAEGRSKPTTKHVSAAVASRTKDKKKHESPEDMAAALFKKAKAATAPEPAGYDNSTGGGVSGDESPAPEVHAGGEAHDRGRETGSVVQGPDDPRPASPADDPAVVEVGVPSDVGGLLGFSQRQLTADEVLALSDADETRLTTLGRWCQQIVARRRSLLSQAKSGAAA